MGKKNLPSPHPHKHILLNLVTQNTKWIHNFDMPVWKCSSTESSVFSIQGLHFAELQLSWFFPLEGKPTFSKSPQELYQRDACCCDVFGMENKYEAAGDNAGSPTPFSGIYSLPSREEGAVELKQWASHCLSKDFFQTTTWSLNIWCRMVYYPPKQPTQLVSSDSVMFSI